jgi:hypothetical protein
MNMRSTFEDLIVTRPTVKMDTKSDKGLSYKTFWFFNSVFNADDISDFVFLYMYVKTPLSNPFIW